MGTCSLIPLYSHGHLFPDTTVHPNPNPNPHMGTCSLIPLYSHGHLFPDTIALFLLGHMHLFMIPLTTLWLLCTHNCSFVCPIHSHVHHMYPCYVGGVTECTLLDGLCDEIAFYNTIESFVHSTHPLNLLRTDCTW